RPRPPCGPGGAGAATSSCAVGTGPDAEQLVQQPIGAAADDLLEPPLGGGVTSSDPIPKGVETTEVLLDRRPGARRGGGHRDPQRAVRRSRRARTHAGVPGVGPARNPPRHRATAWERTAWAVLRV